MVTGTFLPAPFEIVTKSRKIPVLQVWAGMRNSPTESICTEVFARLEPKYKPIILLMFYN